MIKKTAGEVVKVLSKVDPSTPVGMSFLPIEGGHHGAGAINVPFTIDPVTDAKNNVVGFHFTEGHRITLGNENQIMLDGIGTRHHLQQVHSRTIVWNREADRVLDTDDQYAIGDVKPGEGILSRKDFEKAFLEVFIPQPKKPKESSHASAIENLAKGGRVVSTRKSSKIFHVMRLAGSEMPLSDADFKFLWEGDHIELMFTRDGVTTYTAKKYPCRDFTRPSHTNFSPKFYDKNGSGEWTLKEITSEAVKNAVDEGVKLALAGEAVAGVNTLTFPKLLTQDALAGLMGIPKK